jgi:hypothetical protein
MNLADGMKVLLRRWMIVGIGMLITAGLAVLVYERAPQAYQTNAQLLLLLPAGAQGAELPNSPFLYLPTGLNVLASHVAVAPNTQQFRESMVEDGFVETYEVGVNPGVPIINLSVTGTRPDGVIATRDAVIERLGAELERVQDEETVPDRQRAHIRTAGLNERAHAMGGDKLQRALGALALGGLLTLLVAFAVDRRRTSDDRSDRSTGGPTRLSHATEREARDTDDART